MLIDWFTVGAQALNFVILVWLLKRFLYKPVLHAVDEREKRIASERADADAIKLKAGQERDDFQKKNAAFDAQRATLLSKATEAADGERRRLIDEARMAAAALTAQRLKAAEAEASSFNKAIVGRVRQEVFAIARKALKDLADTNLEDRMIDVFTRRLREIDGEPKSELAAAIRTATGPVVVRSAFDMSKERQAMIETAIKATFPGDIPLRFETSTALVGGIELSAGGQKLAWSIAEYLSGLEADVGGLLKAREQPAPDQGKMVKGETR